MCFRRKQTIETDWKKISKEYLKELQKFLDIADNIKEEELRREIINQMLRCDNVLTQFAEQWFAGQK